MDRNRPSKTSSPDAAAQNDAAQRDAAHSDNAQPNDGAPHDAAPCPICAAPVPTDAETFPFCSTRCRQIDLGKWLKGDYRFSRPVEQGDLDEK